MEFLKQCLLCRKEFYSASNRRKFCSPWCRNKYKNLMKSFKFHLKNLTYKQKSLARLLAWKQKKKQEKMLQEAEKQGVKLITVDIEWI